jgi:sulfofructose kinase
MAKVLGEMVNPQPEDAAYAVFGIGWIVYDSIHLVRAYPEENSKMESLRELDQVGGPVARALSVISHLGFKTAIGAVVGADEMGHASLEVLGRRRLLTSHVQMEAGRTRRAHVWISSRNASRTIVYSRGDLPPLGPLSRLTSAAEKSDILHLDGREIQVAVPVARRMRELHKTVVVDAGGWKPDLESLLRYTDILVVSKRTLKVSTRDELIAKAQELRDAHGIRYVIITDGEAGVWGLDGSALHHVPAVHVHAVDTNGAGDTFAGGLIYGLLKEWPIVECLRFASGVAALQCAQFGDSFPHVESVMELLAKGTLP